MIIPLDCGIYWYKLKNTKLQNPNPERIEHIMLCVSNLEFGTCYLKLNNLGL
jgi:hypothetical protein